MPPGKPITEQQKERIERFILQNPDYSARQIAEHFPLSAKIIGKFKKEFLERVNK